MRIVNPPTKKDCFIYVPVNDGGFSISKKKYQEEHPAGFEKPKTHISWYDAKILLEKNGLRLPTSSEWGDARSYAQQQDEQTGITYDNPKSLEREFITGTMEWTDSLISRRGEDGYFPAEIHDVLREVGFDGKVALIEYVLVRRDKSGYVIAPDTRTRVVDVTEIDGRPLPTGLSPYVKSWDENFGLPTEVGDQPNEKYDGAILQILEAPLAPVLRGSHSFSSDDVQLKGRYAISSFWKPDRNDQPFSFRAIKD